MAISRLSKRQIDAIIRRTPESLKGTFHGFEEILGYYSKADTNWAYIAGWTKDGDLVVTVFGQVR